MTRIGILAAFYGELKPLVRTWQRRGPLWIGRLGSCDAVAGCAGMGSAAVIRACEQVLASGPVDALISIGYAGSLSCGLKPPVACAVREVIDAANGERFATSEPDGQRLVTLDHVADTSEKRSLAAEYQAVLIDMEAAAVARVARAYNLGFSCFKAVTDGPNDQLPDFNRFTGPDGQLRLPSLVAYAAIHPRTWAPLRRLGKNSQLAAVELANFLSQRFAASQ